MSTMAVTRLMPWRVQNFAWIVAEALLPTSSPTSARNTQLANSTTAMKMMDSSSLRPLSALTPTQSIPSRCI